jgi:hypothetical protein
VTDEELLAALERDRPVAGLRRRPSPYRTSFALEEVDVRLPDGAALELVLKPAAWSGLSPEARRVRPRFLHDPAREAAVYREVLEPFSIGAPALVAADRDWLLLERVRGDALYEVGDTDAWIAAARWAGRLHAGLADAAPAVAARARLVSHDARFFGLWIERALRLRPDPRLAALAAGYDRVVAELAALPRTVVHGELYPSNVLVERGGARPRIRVVDWERAGHGPGLLDLAALTAGGLDDGLRGAMVSAYREAAGPAAPGEPAFARALDLCRLHLAVQWLGWSRDWTPPAQHAHDWLGEASAAAGRLGMIPR